SYEKLNEYLLQAHQVNDMFERYHSYDEAETIWQQGLDPSSAFYQEIEAWIAPQVEDLVTKDGLEAFINALFSRYYKTVAPDSFTQPAGEFEILAQTDDSFKLEQKKTIPAQEIGGSSYRSEEHTSELQSRFDLVCRLLLEKKNLQRISTTQASPTRP